METRTMTFTTTMTTTNGIKTTFTGSRLYLVTARVAGGDAQTCAAIAASTYEAIKANLGTIQAAMGLRGYFVWSIKPLPASPELATSVLQTSAAC